MSLIVEIMFFLIGAVITGTSLYKDYKADKKMNGFKWFLIIIFILFIIIGIWEIVDKDKSSIQGEKNINDTTKVVGAKLGSRVDTGLRGVHSSIKVVDSDVNNGFKGIKKINPHIVPFALLIYAPSPGPNENPVIKTLKKDSTIMYLYLTNYGTGVAFEIKGTSIGAIKRNGIYIIDSHISPNVLNKSITINPTTKEMRGFQESLDVENYIKDSVFVCIKFDYRDSTKIPKSLPKIFYMNKNLVLTEAEEIDYNNIERLLIEGGYWGKPFGH